MYCLLKNRAETGGEQLAYKNPRGVSIGGMFEMFRVQLLFCKMVIAFVNIPIFEEFTGQNIYINLRMVERTECHMVVYNCFAFG